MDIGFVISPSPLNGGPSQADTTDGRRRWGKRRAPSLQWWPMGGDRGLINRPFGIGPHWQCSKGKKRIPLPLRDGGTACSDLPNTQLPHNPIKFHHMSYPHWFSNLLFTTPSFFFHYIYLSRRLENKVDSTDFAMASRFPLLFLSSLLIVASCCCFAAVDGGNLDSNDPLIRQVVDHGDGAVAGDNELLNADHHFTVFKSKFGKSYASQEEHDHRFSVFKANLRRASRHQKLDPSAVHGVTQFSDLTPREFRNRFLGINRRLRLPSDAQEAPVLPTNDLPKDFDWRDHGAVTAVKNQVCTKLGFRLHFLIFFSRFGFWAIVAEHDGDLCLDRNLHFNLKD